MLGRLGIAGRFLTIALLLLFAAFALGTGTAFVMHNRNTGTQARADLPDQAAAVVELLEHLPAEERAGILRAVNTSFLSVTLSEGLPGATPGASRVPGIEWYIDQYLPAVGEHEILAWAEPEDSYWQQVLSGNFPASERSIRLAISLKNGGYAEFRTRGESGYVFGLPPGFWIGVAGALIAVLALRAIIREARPLQTLAASVKQFGAQARPAPVKPEGAAETRALIHAVNDMQARIAELVSGRTLLLGAISHDLKTFLTRLALRVDTIPDAVQRAKAERDLDDMTRLLEDALAVARGTAMSGRRELVHAAGIVRTEMADREGASIVLEGAEPPAGRIHGDPVALRRLIANLADNALRFGSQCVVTVTAKAHGVTITVDDDGPGIAEEHREAVFTPFYRVEASRNRETGGSGLGLAIAKQIVDGHHGSITIGDSPLGGARLAVELPGDPAAGSSGKPANAGQGRVPALRPGPAFRGLQHVLGAMLKRLVCAIRPLLPAHRPALTNSIQSRPNTETKEH
jgi:two-component system osmolarity sensor histidine kinase EnvZ